MKDGKCPVCNSTEVYTSGKYTFRAGGQVLELSVWVGNNVTHIQFQPYLCKNCGHTELIANWPADLSVLDKDQEWEKVVK